MQSKSLFAKMSLIRKVSKLVVSGVLATDATKEYPLNRVQEAVAASQEPGRDQKILLRIGDSPQK